MKLSNAQIGKCGELLVQLKLLSYGIESAILSTDYGIDLVAFSKRLQCAKTIQVKANLKAKPAGGKGKLYLGWWANDNSAADVFAFVDLDFLRVWLIETRKLASIAQQHSNGRFQFFMSIDPKTKPRRDGKPIHDYQFSEHLFENSAHRIF